MDKRSLLLATALCLAAAPTAPMAQETPTPPGATYTSSIPPQQRRAFFGETHLHTTMSFDAWSFGTRITPDQAYRFGRGETVMVPAEQVNIQQHIHATHPVPAKRAWPLDFMAVTDHSENMGVFNQFDDPKNPLGGYWIGLTGTEGQAVGKMSYGIHGTIDQDSIGKQSSMGCIRLRASDIAMVFDMMVEGKSMVVVKD